MGFAFPAAKQIHGASSGLSAAAAKSAGRCDCSRLSEARCTQRCAGPQCATDIGLLARLDVFDAGWRKCGAHRGVYGTASRNVNRVRDGGPLDISSPLPSPGLRHPSRFAPSFRTTYRPWLCLIVLPSVQLSPFRPLAHWVQSPPAPFGGVSTAIMY